ncbi:hypothetical protein CK203_078853 [Vitis vinifera]|uniref:Uncharacterized protein n=1 Tax=Vitis vinifera TaxID=29760 RepID=A0A438FBT7_VITVI|nr:hypothetical protein CK203_078853 [Vitis vinifera]
MEPHLHSFVSREIPSHFLSRLRSLIFLRMEGVSSVFGEFELAYYGVSREQMVVSSVLDV